MTHYAAIVSRHRNGNWLCHFPDFQNVELAADTAEAVLAAAEEALANFVARSKAAGIGLPEPRSLDAIRADAAWRSFREIDWDSAFYCRVPLRADIVLRAIAVAAEVTVQEREVAFDQYVARCRAAFTELFERAKTQEELQYAMALSPENRGMQDPGWNTAIEAHEARSQILDLINTLPATAVKIRIMLSLYSHLSEAAGFYEVPKNMLRIASGDDYNLWPFQQLVVRHQDRGVLIAPNANKIMKDLVGHADELGLARMRDVILETFDPDIRNGYAHADYIIAQDGIRLRKRNGGQPRIVSYDDFRVLVNKSLAFFECLGDVIGEAMESYTEPRRIVGRMNRNAAQLPAVISYDPDTKIFRIQSGMGL